ncbi:MAG: T9SS type A sorting domain-containing protein, partial [Chitinophagaceae bacterium]
MVTENSATIFYQKIYPKLFYFIRFKEVSASKWDTLPTRDTMVMLPSLKPCTDYVVESKTICDSDTSRFKTMLKFKTRGSGCNTVASGDQVASLDRMNVFPNPFVDNLHVQFNAITRLPNSKVRLLNMNGSVLQEKILGDLISGNHIIDLQPSSNLPPGMYFVQVYSPKGGLTKKVMKLN